MSIYRADPADGVAWITGAATGIGRALALELARIGYTVVITGRPGDPGDEVAAQAAGLIGTVWSKPCDVTDAPGMQSIAAAIEVEIGPIVLAVFNAGIFEPAGADNIDLAAFRRVMDVNFFGVLNGLDAVLDRMRRRGRGHVVLMGSISAYIGWPATGAYGASKAALNNLAEALLHDVAKMNVRLQIMNPGFVATGIVDENSFLRAILMPLPAAAARIAKAIRSGGFETTFPRRFTWGLKLLLRLLPRRVTFSLIHYLARWRGRPLIPRPGAGEGPVNPDPLP